jgi:hypothetical protein
MQMAVFGKKSLFDPSGRWKKIWGSSLLIFASAYGDTSTGTYPLYAPADVPCRQTQIALFAPLL